MQTHPLQNQYSEREGCKNLKTARDCYLGKQIGTMTYLEPLLANPYFLGCLSIVVAYLLSIRLYPVIIYLGHTKNLMDEPEDRSTHINKTPTLGGVGLFISFSLTIILLGISLGFSQNDLIKLLSLLGGTILLLFLGIKDDLLTLSPFKKFMGEIVSSGIVIFITDARIFSFYGLFGLGELPYVISLLFTILVFIFIINAFNLIDGIDGLAGSIATIASLSFGIFFLLNAQYLMVLVSFILIGALVGFLRFNFSDGNKLFMGDSGSLFLGFLLAYQAVNFIALNEAETSTVTVKNAPILALAILSIPILDTLRVFFIRIIKKRSPFTADRNHIHHILVDSGLEHYKATSVICIVNIFIIELAILMSGLYVNVQLYLLAIAVPFVGLVALFLVRRKWRSLNMARHNESPGHRKERPLSFTDFLQQAIFNGSDTLHERQTDRREMEELLKSKKKKHKHKKSSKFKKITMPE